MERMSKATLERSLRLVHPERGASFDFHVYLGQERIGNLVRVGAKRTLGRIGGPPKSEFRITARLDDEPYVVTATKAKAALNKLAAAIHEKTKSHQVATVDSAAEDEPSAAHEFKP